MLGKDDVSGGSWLGFSKKGRFAVLTNYRKDYNSPTFQGTSRGMGRIICNVSKILLFAGTLVLNYLSGETTPTHYSSELMSNASEYDGFNLITGSFGYSQNIHGNTFLSSLSLSPSKSKELVYCSNRGNEEACPLVGGVYGLSNSSLDAPWMKVNEGKKIFKEIISRGLERDELISQLLSLLSDKTWFVVMVTFP